MSLGNTFENDLAKLIFNGAAITNIADNAASSPLGSLYLSLHTSDPGESGVQNTNEATYGDYARVAVDRDSDGFTVSGSSVTLTANVDFPQASSGSETITHFGIGVASSGGTKLIGSGAITPNIAVATGVTPRLTTGTTITFD